MVESGAVHDDETAHPTTLANQSPRSRPLPLKSFTSLCERGWVRKYLKIPTTPVAVLRDVDETGWIMLQVATFAF